MTEEIRQSAVRQPAEEIFVINGGKPLKGEIKLAGAKNAATKMMIASILTEEECILENFPQIGDTAITEQLCRELGSEIRFDSLGLHIKTPSIKTTEVTSLSRRNRIPILAMGPLLLRRGEAKIPLVGGDKIGPRPVDLHIEALKQLGVVIEIDSNYYHAFAPEGLRGAEINFRFPSVGATENTILAAVLAQGKTMIYNAAIEPEIIDLIKMLQNMGAIIELGADRRIAIYGVKKLHGTSYKILPDRNETVSFACLAVAAGGEIFIRDAVQEHLITFLNTLRRVGGEYEVSPEGIKFWRANGLKSISVETSTHPGFMTDWQQPLAVLLTQATGNSVIHETIYEDRFHYTEDLNLMGAKIKISGECLSNKECRFNVSRSPHSAIISGPTLLKGREIKVPDLRAGIAQIIAALIAEGESRITGIYEIDRGYEKIDERLRQLGADIKRADKAPNPLPRLDPNFSLEFENKSVSSEITKTPFF